MWTILITGGMGVGKSQIIDLLRQKSQPVFQADNQAKKFLRTDSVCYSRLRKLFFESDLYLPNGEFNKKRLARKIFQEPKRRIAMEAIIHPLVRKAFERFVGYQKKKGKNKVFYEAPLISMSIFDSCDKTVLVTCPLSIRKKRLLAKGWTEPDIEERFVGQILDSSVENQVDFIIDNSGSFNSLESQLDKILSLLEGNGIVC
ncbi:MAG: dephospho-CoA kinase [Oligoflexia bacterium]|nr:dephospho-CoA kinase [Oligoflexia bacterium]